MKTLLEKVVELEFTLVGTGDRWRKTLEHDSLVLDLREQKWFWNSRGLYRLDPIDFLTRIRNLPITEAKKVLESLSNSVYDSKKPVDSGLVVAYDALVDVFWNEGRHDRSYWHKRCLNDTFIDRFKLGKHDDFFMLPIFVDGELRNFQCRKDFPEKKIRPWYRDVGPLPFNFSILSFIDRVFITEGPVDSVLLCQEGIPAVSFTGGAFGWKKDWFRYFHRVEKIIYVADNDDAGVASAKLISKLLGIDRVFVLQYLGFPEKYDTVDFFRDGHSLEKFKELADKAKNSIYL